MTKNKHPGFIPPPSKTSVLIPEWKVTEEDLRLVQTLFRPSYGPGLVKLVHEEPELLRHARAGRAAEAGRKKGGRAQANRAAPGHEDLVAAYRQFCEENPEMRLRGGKAKFIRQWKGKPHLGPRQIYDVLRSAEP